MGRDSSSGEHAIVYGVEVKVAKDTNWRMVQHRLTEYKHDTSLFAMASRAATKAELESNDVPEQITKSARTAARSILISDRDELTEEEKKMVDADDDGYFPWYMNDPCEFPIEKCSIAAIAKILGDENHSFVLKPYTAQSGYEADDGPLKPVLMLQTEECCKEKYCEPGARKCKVELPPIKDKETVDQTFSTILRSFGLEQAEDGPGWQLVVTNSCDPR